MSYYYRDDMAMIWLKYLYYFILNYYKVKTMVFKDLKIKSEFTYKGINYIKNSDRTARILDSSTVKYFASCEKIYVWRLDK